MKRFFTMLLSACFLLSSSSRALKEGDSFVEVEKELGQPIGEMKMKGQVGWIYARGKVIFEDGKVTSCSWMSEDEYNKKSSDLARIEADKRRAQERTALKLMQENKKKLLVEKRKKARADIVAGNSDDLVKHFKNAHKSKYFVYHYNDDVSIAKRIARFSDGFVDYISREFFPAEFDYPIHVFVLKDRAAFKKFMIEEMGNDNPSDWGTYYYSIKTFVSYQESGNGTFAHEIMHPLMRNNLPKAPFWADEGIPGFFEKSFGYWDKNKLILSVGYENPWRVESIGKKIPSLDLESIVKSRQEYGTGAKRMVSVFMYKNGKLRDYMRLVRSNNKKGYDTFLEAAFDKKMPEIIPLWKKYLQDVMSHWSQIMRIPGSEDFDTKEKYDMFMKTRGL